MRTRLITACVAIALTGAFHMAEAQTSNEPAVRNARQTQSARQTTTARQTTSSALARSQGVPSASATIMGFVWSTEGQPIPDAVVRLRNVLTGRIEATTTTSQRGEFVYQNVEGGTYLIELLDAKGKVRAVGSVFTIQAGETVATFVRLPAGAPLMAGLLTNAGAAAVSTAAGIGVTAVTTGPPVSATR